MLIPVAQSFYFFINRDLLTNKDQKQYEKIYNTAFILLLLKQVPICLNTLPLWKKQVSSAKLRR